MAVKTYKTKSGKIIDWYLIDNPRNKKQAELIAKGEELYWKLFKYDEIREPYKNFKDYAKDSALALRNLKKCKIVDSWYLGVAEDTLRGFVFFTLYPEEGLGVIPYMGAPGYGETVKDLIDGETKELFSSLPFEAYLFELEKIFPTETDKVLTPKETDRRRALTYIYQEKGAWKIPWIDYRQPPLIKDKNFQITPMHLMYWPTSQNRNFRSESFSVQDVKRIVNFMYLVFYLDGYKATEKKEDIPYWKAKLKEMHSEAVGKYLSSFSSVNFKKMPAKPSSPTVFLSYPDSDKNIAEKIAFCLRDFCIEPFFWPKDRYGLISHCLDKDIEEKFKEAKAVIYLITEHTYKALGQRKEIEFLKKYSQKKLFIISYLEKDELEYLGLPVEGEKAVVYGGVESNDDFVKNVDGIIDNLISWNKDLADRRK